MICHTTALVQDSKAFQVRHQSNLQLCWQHTCQAQILILPLHHSTLYWLNCCHATLSSIHAQHITNENTDTPLLLIIHSRANPAKRKALACLQALADMQATADAQANKT
jgi:hypothetical protein